VLLATRTGVGKVAISANPLCISQDITGIICKPVVRPAYLARFLFSMKSSLIRRVRGATIKGLARRDFEDIEVPVPSIEIQRRIETILDLAERLKEKRARASHLTSKLAQSVFAKMFPKELHSPMVRLGDISQVMDVDHRMPTKTMTGVPLISTTELTSGEDIDFRDAKFISEEDYVRQAKKCTPRKGDVLLTRYGTVGVAKLVRTDTRFAVSYSICIIRPSDEVVPEYLEALMNSEIVQRQAKAGTIGIAIPDLGLKEIRNFQVPLLNLSRQNSFKSVVGSTRAIANSQLQSERKIDSLFQSLMQEAFNGELKL
jgi:type I restriction enzyme, S subunit